MKTILVRTDYTKSTIDVIIHVKEYHRFGDRLVLWMPEPSNVVEQEMKFIYSHLKYVNGITSESDISMALSKMDIEMVVEYTDQRSEAVADVCTNQKIKYVFVDDLVDD